MITVQQKAVVGQRPEFPRQQGKVFTADLFDLRQVLASADCRAGSGVVSSACHAGVSASISGAVSDEISVCNAVSGSAADSGTDTVSGSGVLSGTDESASDAGAVRTDASFQV